MLTVHEYIIVYILLSNLIYIYIYTIYIYIYILYIYIKYILYIYYIYMDFVFFVYCNIVATHTYDGHTGFTFMWSFPADFTSRHGQHNCEHDPNY